MRTALTYRDSKHESFYAFHKSTFVFICSSIHAPTRPTRKTGGHATDKNLATRMAAMSAWYQTVRPELSNLRQHRHSV